MTDQNLPLSLIEHNGEPRVRDLDLAERLGFTDAHKIRVLIDRNREELAGYGEVSATAAETSEKGGRPGKEYHLNEGQALAVCALSRTKRAAEVRHMLIGVFMAWRRGQIGGVSAEALADAVHRMLPALVTDLVEARLMADPRVAARHVVSAKELLDEERIPSKGRRGLVISSSADLRGWCTDHDTFPLRCPRTRTWLFPAEQARKWMRERGRGLIAAWRDRQNGQSNLFAIKGGRT